MLKIPNKTEKLIKEFTTQVYELLGERVKKIILYGSYARGDFNKSSDIDIMILTDLTDEEIVDTRTQLWDIAYDIGLDNDVMISVIVKNINDYNYWLDTLPFYMNVQKEGVVIDG